MALTLEPYTPLASAVCKILRYKKAENSIEFDELFEILSNKWLFYRWLTPAYLLETLTSSQAGLGKYRFGVERTHAGRGRQSQARYIITMLPETEARHERLVKAKKANPKKRKRGE